MLDCLGSTGGLGVHTQDLRGYTDGTGNARDSSPSGPPGIGWASGVDVPDGHLPCRSQNCGVAVVSAVSTRRRTYGNGWLKAPSAVQQHVEMQDPVAAGWQLGGPLIATRQAACRAMELQNLAKQCKQHLGESVPAWLL